MIQIIQSQLHLLQLQEGFLDGENITLVNTSASTGLAEDVEWNDFRYYHDHADDGTEYCPPGGRHHFDFDYWNAGGLAGLNCDIFLVLTRFILVSMSTCKDCFTRILAPLLFTLKEVRC